MRRTAIMAACVAAMAAVSTFAAEYVVDQKNPQAADTNPGTAAAPFKTISAAVAKVQPGDTVTVKAGTYAERVTVPRGGEDGKPVVLRAAAGERVVIGGGAEERAGITWAPGTGHLRIAGFEVRGVTGSGGNTGITADGGHHVEVEDCVVIGTRILLANLADSVVRRCVQTGSSANGITLSRAKNCTIEECEVFANTADGIIVAGNCDGCKVLRNYVHNNWYDNHPDGIQVYRTVTDFLVEGNLFFNSGQGFMLQETDQGVFRNNVICGTHHSGMILGHRNSHNWTVEQNTIAFTGYGALTYSGKGTVIRNNIILAGGDNKLIRQASEDPCAADHNFLWKPEGATVAYGVPAEAAATSKFGDPKFRNAPPLGRKAVFYIDAWAYPEIKDKSTVERLFLGGRPLSASFSVGDHVEVNFDGKVRTVAEVAEDSIAFTPPLEKMHKYPWEVVVNWKEKTDFAWDLRLAPDSPARKMGDKGQDVGSSIDMQAYMKGDFNGDGKRDLPAVPADVAGR